MTRASIAAACLLALAACQRDGARTHGQPLADSAAAHASSPAWSTNPVAGPLLSGAPDSAVVETGPHTILWPASARPARSRTGDWQRSQFRPPGSTAIG